MYLFLIILLKSASYMPLFFCNKSNKFYNNNKKALEKIVQIEKLFQMTNINIVLSTELKTIRLKFYNINIFFPFW